MRAEKKAVVVSSSVAALLMVMKMTVGVISGSIAVIASAIDSLLDLVVSLFNYFALHQSEKNPDKSFNFGRTKIEPLASVIEGVVITMSALFIFYEAIGKMYENSPVEHLDVSIWVMVISTVITYFLVMYLQRMAKKTGNMVLEADALHYKTDLYSNGAILFALVAIHLTSENLIDPVLGIAIAIYMIYSAIPIIKNGILMLLDAALEEESVAKIKNVLDTNREITDYHFLTTRQSADDIFISVHLVYTISISLYDAHLIADRVEAEFKDLFPENSVHPIIHMDPYDDSEINEEEH
ncbi:MAG: cation diffusion facilitator family transporter [Helicobacteraceae bacterium]|nr:cation diffusion facilitator family transporter [Helicobacteraceae bacterium]